MHLLIAAGSNCLKYWEWSHLKVAQQGQAKDGKLQPVKLRPCIPADEQEASNS